MLLWLGLELVICNRNQVPWPGSKIHYPVPSPGNWYPFLHWLGYCWNWKMQYWPVFSSAQCLYDDWFVAYLKITGHILTRKPGWSSHQCLAITRLEACSRSTSHHVDPSDPPGHRNIGEWCSRAGWGQIVLAANHNCGMLQLIASHHDDDDDHDSYIHIWYHITNTLWTFYMKQLASFVKYIR